MFRKRTGWLLALLPLAAAAAIACSSDNGDSTSASPVTLTVYSGRAEGLIGPIMEQFTQETGIQIQVRYGGTAEMAATILEEGRNSPADIFIAQDTSGLGAVQNAGLFEPLDASILDQVQPAWRSASGGWIGLSGRVRVIVYNVASVPESELPQSITEVLDPKWSGRIGWAPTNGSLQMWVTAFRLVEGDAAVRAFLEGLKANGAVEYPNNTAIVEAAANGEIDLGLVNHYYLHRFLTEQGQGFGARNHYTDPGDIGSMVGVAGAGILATSGKKDAAKQLIEFLLSDRAQRYFADETYEYPVVSTVAPNADLPSLDNVVPPAFNLDDLADLEGTLDLMRSAGALP